MSNICKSLSVAVASVSLTVLGATGSFASELKGDVGSGQIRALLKAMQANDGQSAPAANRITPSATTASKTVTVNFSVVLSNPLPAGSMVRCWSGAWFWTYDDEYNLVDSVEQMNSTAATLVNARTRTYSCSVTTKYSWVLNDAEFAYPEIGYGADIRATNGSVVSLPRWIDSVAWKGYLSDMPSVINAAKLAF